MKRLSARDERGVMIVLVAIVLPLMLITAAAVWDVGNWWTHRKHLQTKADAAAFAGGGAWSFPCTADASVRIVDEARKYVGAHMGPGNQDFTGGTRHNPQIGGTPGQNIHVVLNGSDWWDDDASLDPADGTAICEAKFLDVKTTEANNEPLFGLIPFVADIKRKAKVEIQEAQGLSGLLPIGVRIPKPAAAAAVFYDETNGVIRDVKYFCEKPNGFAGLPAGLGGWTTLDTGISPDPMCNSWADLTVGVKTGIVIATNVRGACGFGTPPVGNPCMEDSGWAGQPVNNFCRQGNGTTQCWDATGGGSTQTVQAGVQFIRGEGTAATGTGPPQLRAVYLDSHAPAGCLGSYFSSFPSQCLARLTAKLDLGNLQGLYPPPNPPGGPPALGPLRAGDVEVRFMLGRSDGSTQCNYGNNCDVGPTDANATGAGVTYTTSGTSSSPHLQIPAESLQNGVGIQVRVRNAQNSPNANCRGNNFNNNCRFWWTGTGMVAENQADSASDLVARPVQRAFSGSVDRTGPLKWLHLVADLGPTCNGVPDRGFGGGETVDGATVPAGRNCFYVEMGLQGAIARDQDEPPIAFNLGSSSSQRALLDCDPAHPNLSDEIQFGCGPTYQRHPFTYTPYCPADNNPAQLLGPHPAPWDASNNWPPPQCVVTQTGASNQIIPGFNQRLFGVNNNPTCPPDNAAFRHGRNYWHDANNNFLDPVTGTYDTYTFAQDNPAPPRGNRLLVQKDPRYVTLFFTTYDSFASSGNETFPIVGFGGFYVTGYGRTTSGGGAWQGGAPEDPCTDGNSGNPFDGLPYGVGNEPPPDLNLGANQTWVWGHFITPVFPASGGTPSGRPCDPVSGRPCVVVLVE